MHKFDCPITPGLSCCCGSGSDCSSGSSGGAAVTIAAAVTAAVAAAVASDARGRVSGIPRISCIASGSCDIPFS